MTAHLRSRAYAAAPHVANGMKLRDDLKLQEALTEFQRAVEIDSTNFVAAQEANGARSRARARENEIVFAITPHIVGAEEITDENLRLIDVGTSSSIGLRYKESKPAKSKDSQSLPAQSRERPQPKVPLNPTSSSPSSGPQATPQTSPPPNASSHQTH